MPQPKYSELGFSGLTEYGGVVDEEKLYQLKGTKAVKVYREMADNDDVVGAILFATEMLLRRVAWSVEPGSDSPGDRDVAEFIESCKDDMSHPWVTFISEVLSMLTYGWASCEIVYKQRVGPDEKDPTRRSRYTDGRIGWRKLPLRAQDTLYRWEFDDDGGVKGWYQLSPIGGAEVFLPIEKLLHFRTMSRRNNPEGRSILRSAYLSWYRKKHIERIEAIGIERDLAGLPMMYLPPEILAAQDAETQALLAEYKQILRNLRNDEQASLLFPAAYDEKGNQLYKFELAGTGSRRLIDTNQTVNRYKQAIASTILADVILLGHEKVGSFALASSKTELFSLGLAAWLDEIEEVLNRFAVPRLLRVNSISVEEPPRFKHGDLEKVDILEWSQALAQLITTGMITPGSPDDEDHARELLNLPERPEDLDPALVATQTSAAKPPAETDPNAAPEDLIDG